MIIQIDAVEGTATDFNPNISSGAEEGDFADAVQYSQGKLF